MLNFSCGYVVIGVKEYMCFHNGGANKRLSYNVNICQNVEIILCGRMYCGITVFSDGRCDGDLKTFTERSPYVF